MISDLRMYNSENHTAIGVACNNIDGIDYGHYAIAYASAPNTARYNVTAATVATDNVNTLNCSAIDDSIAVGGTGNVNNSNNLSNAYRALANASNIVGAVHNVSDDYAGYWLNF